jgi:hypothetical protein
MTGGGMNMEKFIIWHDVYGDVGKPEATKYEYKLDDIHTVWDVGTFKCIGIESNDNKIFYHFKQGKTILTYDY